MFFLQNFFLKKGCFLSNFLTKVFCFKMFFEGFFEGFFLIMGSVSFPCFVFQCFFLFNGFFFNGFYFRVFFFQLFFSIQVFFFLTIPKGFSFLHSFFLREIFVKGFSSIF